MNRGRINNNNNERGRRGRRGHGASHRQSQRDERSGSAAATPDQRQRSASPRPASQAQPRQGGREYIVEIFDRINDVSAGRVSVGQMDIREQIAGIYGAVDVRARDAGDIWRTAEQAMRETGTSSVRIILLPVDENDRPGNVVRTSVSDAGQIQPARRPTLSASGAEPMETRNTEAHDDDDDDDDDMVPENVADRRNGRA
ncbi:hypothetical protein PLIIFM63780_006250 [Purpureocillium lilacinum]|nr:hypothetical protein PLIIFM63780_006250 [Purpureocillium lilacinum]